MRALVTGGAGFLGSHLSERLAGQGARVTIVDDLSTGRLENLEALRPTPGPLPLGPDAGAAELIVSDLGHALEGPLAGRSFDRVYHLAASVGVRRVMDDPADAIERNVVLTARLMRWLVAGGLAGFGAAAGAVGPAGAAGPAGGTSGRVLIASSSEVYGKSERAPFAEGDDSVFGPTTALRWSYACSKALDEHLALAHHQRHGLGVVIARLFNTVGPRQVGDYGMVLPRFVGAALRDEPLEVHGDGEQVRCLCDVRDVVDGLCRLTEHPGAVGGVFNIGSDQPMTISELAARVVRVVGSQSLVVKTPYQRVFGAGFEDLRRRVPDLRKVRALIGFDPGVPFDQTIRDVARWIADADGCARGSRDRFGRHGAGR
ncbi:MAG: nucleoside-diphosphate sugar epimerase [Planctomyces sp.]|nr:nucleoside-diphosphate sugar epimerase [Planctomyces sp.]MBA4039986.1 nucleoside-diphosphate sugar epimerase [Planctomyces sp.]MBA4120264.1 nucleoside-diphosphate sugar epimerase [Isosphaera sp.]